MPVRIRIEHKGQLGGKGFFQHSASSRHRMEQKLARNLGERHVLGQLAAIATFNKNRNPSLSRKARLDQRALAKHYHPDRY